MLNTPFYRIAKVVTRRIWLDMCSNVPIVLKHWTEFRSEATSPPLTKGDLGGMSILVSQKRSRFFRLLFVIPAVKAVWFVGRKRSKRCVICTKYPHTILTKELTCWIC